MKHLLYTILIEHIHLWPSKFADKMFKGIMNKQ